MEVMGNFVEMYTEASRLSQKFGDVATIKVPMTKDGLTVCRQLTQVDGVRCNVTLIFCGTQQSWQAAKAESHLCVSLRWSSG